MNSLLRCTSESASKRSCHERTVQQRPPPVSPRCDPRDSVTNPRSPSLTITLSGIRSKHLPRRRSLPDRGTLNSRLHFSYADPASRLEIFSHDIRGSFDAAGFRIPGYREYIEPECVFLSTAHASSRPKTTVRSHKDASKLQRAGPPLFETREITRKFENFVFAENIRLERLTLCALGLMKAIEKCGAEAQLSEVCSVPLP